MSKAVSSLPPFRFVPSYSDHWSFVASVLSKPISSWKQLREAVNVIHQRAYSVVRTQPRNVVLEYEKAAPLVGLQEAIDWFGTPAATSVLPVPVTSSTLCSESVQANSATDSTASSSAASTVGSQHAPSFYDAVLPKIQALALRLPRVLAEWENGTGLQVLQAGHTASVTVPNPVCLSLLANAFFGNQVDYADQIAALPQPPFGFAPVEWGQIDWLLVYGSSYRVGVERIKCFISTFYMALCFPDYMEKGAVTFHRSFLDVSRFPRWETLNVPISPVNIHTGAMEIPGIGMFVDFANADLHIGSIIPSATQEEILFSVRPYLFIGMLFSQRMRDHEAIIMSGAPQTVKYTGYSNTFKFAGIFSPTEAGDLPIPQIVAIDAVMLVQFNKECIIRDIEKAYVGFRGDPSNPPHANTISTGGWGCGAFGGDIRLKFLQQVIAASASGLRMEFSTWGDQGILRELSAINQAMQRASYTVRDVYNLVMSYEPYSEDDDHTPAFRRHLARTLRISLS
ncbi:poly glycohydrolase [Pelomyxa schiedti]|nr:poly glycohydrolase [Pelomyxa schiedti]